jgi:hypothetical protein
MLQTKGYVMPIPIFILFITQRQYKAAMAINVGLIQKLNKAKQQPLWLSTPIGTREGQWTVCAH